MFYSSRQDRSDLVPASSPFPLSLEVGEDQGEEVSKGECILPRIRARTITPLNIKEECVLQQAMCCVTVRPVKTPSRKTALLQRWDKETLWHPFTQMRDWERADPMIIERGRGSTVYDTEGRSYLDGVASLWVNVHGHRKAAIDRALKQQIDRIAHSTLLGLSNVPSILLARKLIRIAPRGLSRVFYSDNGSTAVEVALKMAFLYWKRQGSPYRAKQKFLTFREAYHGDTVGAVSLGGIPLFHGAFRPLLFPTVKVDPPYCYRCPLALKYPRCRLACLKPVEKILGSRSREIAGVVVEPGVMAAGGMIVLPQGYLKRLRALCDRHDVLLIADEVATGFGRTGKMFACEHEEVSPDLVAVAKGLTGGYLPLAATLASERIYRAFLGEYSEFKTFFHGHSYTGNPLGCAAALANLEIFRKERVLPRVRRLGRFLENALRPLKRRLHVGDIRRIGLIAGIELVRNRETRKPYPLEERIGIRVCEKARAMGLLLRPLGSIIVLFPPLSVTETQIRRMVRIVDRAIVRVTEGN